MVIIHQMKVRDLHRWRLSPARARETQQKLSARVLRSGRVERVRFIAGVDMAVGRANEEARAAAVVLNYPQLELVAVATARGRLNFPYVPGLLSFREAPLLLEALKKLDVTPDLMLVDGQGIAHPRRFGLACHLGLFAELPTIGCAKSRLCGHHREPGEQTGSCAEMIDDGETIGAALRTKSGVKPVYVSIGHRISLDDARYWVLECCRGYRLPEPLRLAHLAAGGRLEPDAVAA